MLNSAIFNTNYKTNPNRFDLEIVKFSRPLNITWEAVRNGFINTIESNPTDNKIYVDSDFSKHHDGEFLIEKKEFIEQIIIDQNLKDKNGNLVKPIEASESLKVIAEELGVNTQEKNYILVGAGYKGSKEIEKEKGKLVSNLNDRSDVEFLQAGNFDAYVVDYGNNNDYENASNLFKVYGSYNNQADYFAVPIFNTYNSNSFANTLCIYSGGLNCGRDVSKMSSPGDYKIIPKNYFNNNQ
jgi:hypothetical protein